MRWSSLVIAAWVAASVPIGAAFAKTLAEGAVPVNVPPVSYTGRSFVDNDGCIYVRAGVGGATTWVPRVSRSRDLICGQPPTFSAGAPAASVAPLRSPAPPPVIVPAPRAAAATSQAPVPIVRQPRSGGIPTYAVNLPPLPEGYRPLWDDGRLNPLRGVPADAREARRNADLAGANAGQSRVVAVRNGAPMAERLTDMVGPREGVRRAVTKSAASGPLVISSKAANVPLSRPLVQVARFEALDAARGAALPFLEAGIATKIGRVTRWGQTRHLVLLGPFRSAEARDDALALARDAGYPEAYARK